MYKLRKYQKEAVEKGIETFKKRRRDILVLPSGSGKSLVIASIAKHLSGKTLVFQPTKEILLQNLEKMKSFGISDIGIFSASLNEKTLGKKITFATIGTLYNQKHLWDNFDNIVIDECQYVNAKGGMYEEFLSNRDSILGVTATPFRLHSYNDIKTWRRAVVAKMLNRTRPKLFDNITHITQIKEMYEQGFLCPIKYTTENKYEHSELQLNSTGMDFTDASVTIYNKKNNILDRIIDSIVFMISKRKRHILIFNKFVEESEQLSEDLNNMGISAECISAKTKPKDRATILKKFKEGKIKVVVNVGVLTTGYDFPALDCVILARPTQSVSLYYQMIGRCIRPHANKDYAEVIDLCGNVKRFGEIKTFKFVKVSTSSNLLRLKSEVGFLTGFDFVSNKDVEQSKYKGLEEGNYNQNIIYIGKWNNNGKGTPIQKINTEYMEWASENFDEGDIRNKFIKELERRRLNQLKK